MRQVANAEVIQFPKKRKQRLDFWRKDSIIKENNEDYTSNSADQEQKSIHNKHDRGYKYLLSSKKIFLELLRSFVQRGWVDQIDESEIVKMDKSYVLPDFSEKEADLVYRLTFKDRDVIFYILNELQSTVDYLMPYRLLLYKVEIWRDYIKDIPQEERERKGFRLPAIVPIVLYNGDDAWTVSRTFRGMLGEENLFGDEILDFRYILLDVQRYSPEDLIELSNVIGAVFLLDQKTDRKELIERLKKVMAGIEQTPQDQRQRFFTWLTHILSRKVPKEHRHEVEEILSEIKEKGVSEVISNLERTLDEIMQESRQEGWQEGRQEGIEEGMKKGEQESKEKVAKKLLLKGVDDSLVAEVTGLPIAKIEAMKKQLDRSAK